MPAFPKGVSTRRSLLARDVRRSLDRTMLGRNVLLFLLPSYAPSPPVPSVDALPSSSAISLDKLLDAGLYTGEVTEIVGAPGSGKTQVHLQPAARRRVGGGGCIVLDLWGSFCQHPVISELRREKTSGKEGDLNSCLGAHLHLWDLDEIWWGYPILGPFWGLRFTQWPVSTQVCLCVAAHVAHGLQQNVLYIDSNGGLTASRILQLLQARTPDEEEQVKGRKVDFLGGSDIRPHYLIRQEFGPFG